MDVTLLQSAKILAAAPLSCSGFNDSKKSSKSEATVCIPSTLSANKTSESVIFTGTGGKCTSRIEVNRAECTSAVTESVSSSEKDFHVVKIKISPEQVHEVRFGDRRCLTSDVLLCDPTQSESEKTVNKPKVTVVSLKPSLIEKDRISQIDNNYIPRSSQVLQSIVLHEKLSLRKADSFTSESLPTVAAAAAAVVTNKPSEMVQKPSGDLDVNNPTYLYYMMTSGQCSPSDTLDSGTCSDLESGNNNTTNSITPPPLPKKMGSKLKLQIQNSKIAITMQEINNKDKPNDNAQHNRTGSFTDSEESESSLSCDSLNSSELARNSGCISIPLPPLPPLADKDLSTPKKLSFFPDSLLRDIRDRKFVANNKDYVDPPRELSQNQSNGFKANFNTSKLSNTIIFGDSSRERNKTCVLITQEENEKTARIFENDKFYTFHINEKDDLDDLVEEEPKIIHDETFAGYRDIHSGTSTIRSSKGTVRGVKNRVRNGIATFLQMQHSNVKNYKEKDSGKVVLYTTSMGVVRETYAKCANMKQILRTLLVKFEERDVFMSSDYQQEIKERMQSDEIHVPQLFVEGQHIGGAEAVERLNESGELRKMLKPYKSMNASYTCQVCGGYRLLPCPSCNGSKKSVHRNHFTAEFVALKCMNCDEVGLVKCHSC